MYSALEWLWRIEMWVKYGVLGWGGKRCFAFFVVREDDRVWDCKMVAKSMYGLMNVLQRQTPVEVDRYGESSTLKSSLVQSLARLVTSLKSVKDETGMHVNYNMWVRRSIVYEYLLKWEWEGEVLCSSGRLYIACGFRELIWSIYKQGKV